MIDSSNVTCVILASGASTRFGRSKMLHQLGEGVSILAKTIGIYRAIFDQVNVVVRHDDKAVIRLVEHQGANGIININSELGLSQSIIAGVEGVPQPKAWLFALGDMPYVSSDTIRSLTLRASLTEIVVPRTRIGNGNPIVFGAQFKKQLLGLTGDVGAKHLLKLNAQHVSFYDCQDIGIHHDIDRISDIL
ncbi:MAG: molybdenum cofactor cytidylyltransferase [Porticoccaceae bacterium]|jgi:molybdenum cofactor cytidylyltransferase